MKSCVVFCTIRSTKAFGEYAKNFNRFSHTPDVIVVDEDGSTRSLIKQQLKDFSVEFYGKCERAKWFRIHKVDPLIVPPKTTDVIGFSLLVAYPRRYDMIVFVDDDTYPLPDKDFLWEHYKSLSSRRMPVKHGSDGWVNPHPYLYLRGFPYTLRVNHGFESKGGSKSGSILNMGVADYVPDLNAMDYLQYGSLTGQYVDENTAYSGSYILGNSFMPLSRMNIAFNPKIIPAFYQLTGSEFGIGRYGDVFSGLFIMKIAKHLGHNVSFGLPICVHRKEPRDVFRDMRCELEAIKLNETLWRVLDKVKLKGNSYASCYLSLAEDLLKFKSEFHLPLYITYLVQKMRGWVQSVSCL